MVVILICYACNYGLLINFGAIRHSKSECMLTSTTQVLIKTKDFTGITGKASGADLSVLFLKQRDWHI